MVNDILPIMNRDKNKTRLSGFQGDQSKKKQKGCEC